MVESLPLRINSVSPYTIFDDIKLKQPDNIDLKEQLEDETGVRKEKIKLVGIKCKKEFRDINNNKITDQTLVHQLELKSKKKGFIMIGTLDKNAFKVQFLFIATDFGVRNPPRNKFIEDESVQFQCSCLLKAVRDSLPPKHTFPGFYCLSK